MCQNDAMLSSCIYGIPDRNTNIRVNMSTVFDFQFTSNQKKNVNLNEFKGKPALIVNTASKCGFTNQYKGLEMLYQTYKERGLTIIGFPCDQFGGQEPGSDEQIAEFCEVNFGVTFPLSEKVEVNGPDAHPLYKHLCNEAPGILGSKRVKWNFTKFLINGDGHVVKRYAPTVKPLDLADDIEALL